MKGCDNMKDWENVEVINAQKAQKSTKKKYLLTVETDFDFSFIYKGKLMADCNIVLQMESVKDLDDIILQGPFGAPSLPEKRWEFDEAMKAIRENPDIEFSNTGGNRGVKWLIYNN